MPADALPAGFARPGVVAGPGVDAHHLRGWRKAAEPDGLAAASGGP